MGLLSFFGSAKAISKCCIAKRSRLLRLKCRGLHTIVTTVAAFAYRNARTLISSVLPSTSHSPFHPPPDAVRYRSPPAAPLSRESLPERSTAIAITEHSLRLPNLPIPLS